MKFILEILVINKESGELIYHRLTRPINSKAVHGFFNTLEGIVISARDEYRVSIHVKPVYSYKEGDIIF